MQFSVWVNNTTYKKKLTDYDKNKPGEGQLEQGGEEEEDPHQRRRDQGGPEYPARHMSVTNNCYGWWYL